MKHKWLDQFMCEYEMQDGKEICTEVIERIKLSSRWNQSVTTGGSDRYTRDSDQIYFEASSPAVEHEPILEFSQNCLAHYLEKNKEANNCAAFGAREGYNILRYKGDGSQAYHAVHSDHGFPELTHRHLTFCLYLNDIEEGGETEFPQQELLIKPEAGKAIMFPAGWMYSHRSLPHKTGTDRYIFNLFYGFFGDPQPMRTS